MEVFWFLLFMTVLVVVSGWWLYAVVSTLDAGLKALAPVYKEKAEVARLERALRIQKLKQELGEGTSHE